MTYKPRTPAAAMAGITADIETQLIEFQEVTAANFNLVGAADWAHVGTADHIRAKLADLLDMMQRRGEYAN